MLTFLLQSSIVLADKIDISGILPTPYHTLYQSLNIEQCGAVISSDFNSHLTRSFSPGIDIDFPTQCIDSELLREDLPLVEENFPSLGELAGGLFPVTSPVYGMVFLDGLTPFGAVLICDRINENNGKCSYFSHYHKLLHGKLIEDIGRNKTYIDYLKNYIKYNDLINGSPVNKGDFLFYLGNTKTKRDHVHYSIYRIAPGPRGDETQYYLNPSEVEFNKDGSVIHSEDYDYYFYCGTDIKWDNPVVDGKVQNKIQYKIEGKITRYYKSRKFNSYSSSENYVQCDTSHAFYDRSEIDKITWKSGSNSGEVEIDTNTWHWSLSAGEALPHSLSLTVKLKNGKEDEIYELFFLAPPPNLEIDTAKSLLNNFQAL